MFGSKVTNRKFFMYLSSFLRVFIYFLEFLNMTLKIKANKNTKENLHRTKHPNLPR